MQKLLLIAFISVSANLFAQTVPKPKVSVSGTMGISYEGYGLTVNPKTPVFYIQGNPGYFGLVKLT